MNTTIKRRLERIEAAILPKPAKVIRMLAEPQDGATDEEREQYARDLAKALAECDKVIILTALKPLPPSDGKRTYVKDETAAQFQAAMHMPSKRGNSCLLVDSIQDAMKGARVLQPVKQPAS